jgi:hypothetical protein
MIASVDRLFTASVQRDPLGVQKERRVSEANGADLVQVVAMLNNVIAMQRETRLELAELRRELHALRTEHGRRLDDLAAQVASLREEVASYHATVVGHGILISELDERVRRLEQRGQPA